MAAGAGVIIGTGAAAGIATTAGAATLGSLFGVAGAGLAGNRLNFFLPNDYFCVILIKFA